jgi:hypothetical protein
MRRFLLISLLILLAFPCHARSINLFLPVNKAEVKSETGAEARGNINLTEPDSLAKNDTVKAIINDVTAGHAKNEGQKESGSFFKSNFLYFIGAAAVAAVVYILLPEKNQPDKNKATFGTPAQPK